MIEFMLTAILALVILAITFGLMLGFAAVQFKVDADPTAEKIEDILPQTQCGQCGYPGCKPYAEAVANGEAAINLCTPGGQDAINKIADIMGVDPEPAEGEDETPKVAFINEDMCIGCTKCIAACPVDAIIGTNRQIHTILASECTGCNLCVAPCPTECIQLVPVKETPYTWKWDLASQAPSTPDKPQNINDESVGDAV